MQNGHDAPGALTLEMRHLRLVLAVHEQGSVTRAGERLHLSQSALSHQLQDLESRLGVQLFRRVRRRLVISEAGERVLEAALRVLPELQAVEEALRRRVADRRGRLRVTTECYTVYEWFPRVLRRFARRFPEVEVQIVAEATSRPGEAVRVGEVDLALVTHAGGPGLDTRSLFHDELFLATEPGHRLAGRAHVSARDLAPETLLLYGPPATSTFYQQFLAPSGHAPRRVMQVALTEALLALVRSGLGVGVLAHWVLRPELARGAVAAVRLGPRGLQREWKAVSRAGERRPAWMEHFVDLLAADGAGRAGGGPRLRAG
jgi:LysR family transcriptional regulator for metE and metH